ncbi:ABC transporter permease [Bilifractor porci]|uniref:ABC transporter permease n=1 Tax=Bilifractor porci TaxID=2606636 RepID=A0A7X2P9W5_9FIRM|nr:ABC transporter permease [Bilifractor porci]MST82934.1 ABC transporter permease [Bilifractor porci]
MVRQGKTAGKLARRSILAQKKRYFAILLIVLLSVGFLSGLKVTKGQMWDAAGRYLAAANMYDYRIYSTLGFSQEDINKLGEVSGIYDAEGEKTADVILDFAGTVKDYQVLSLPEKINIPSLYAGRLPEKDTECLADHRAFSEGDIGKNITVSTDNDADTRDLLANEEYTIVGLVNSPLFLSSDRGSASDGTGERGGYLYLPADNFTSDYYTGADLVLNPDSTGKAPAEIFGEKYEDLIEKYQGNVEQEAKTLSQSRYEDILSEIKEAAAAAASQASGTGSATSEGASTAASSAYAEEMAAAGDEENVVEEPKVYVLTRSKNAGYVSFESDTSIIHSIANIFPLFFIMIALLVCVTTMLRMVEEERGQIGTLKALGYSETAITGKYLRYALSAAILGWTGGFFFGTYFLPRGFWAAYSTLYDFIGLRYIFDGKLAIVTLLVTVLSIGLGTLAACARVMRETPASLIRPRSARPGKRILLEYCAPIWRKLSFLRKATLRNMLRYKIRMLMMLAGIGCSGALVVTAFGVRDSMAHIGSQQYDGVQTYQLECTIDTDQIPLADIVKAVREEEDVTKVLPSFSKIVDVSSKEAAMNSVSLYAFENDADLSGFWNLSDVSGGAKLSLPEGGAALVSKRLSEKLGLSEGTKFTISEDSLTLQAGHTFVNYIGNFILTSQKTAEDLFGEANPNTLLVCTKNLSAEQEQSLAEKLGKLSCVTGITRLSESRVKVDRSVACLNYIIWLIIAFAGALSFIVIFNLTNINLEERSREIATVEVLGFTPGEVRFYVLRENLVLSFFAGLLGIPLGILCTHAVMNRILLDTMTYHIEVRPLSCVLSLLITVLFAVIVNFLMRRQIRRINMAESLKAVE